MSVERAKERRWIDVKTKRNAQDCTQIQGSLPRAGLMRKLDTIGVNLQDLHYVWVVGTHHMETHLHGRESNTNSLKFVKSFMLKPCTITTTQNNIPQEVIHFFKLQQRQRSI